MIPQYYEFIDQYNSSFSPSTVHVKNTTLQWYFRRYLTQKVMSVFKFENIPDNWDIDYFLYTLFMFGRVAVIDTDKYGVIPQFCTLHGYNVYYRPTNALITNPLIKQPLDPVIGVDCALIKMQPDYGGAWDIVTYYSDLMALAAEALGVNLVNSKLAFIFAAESKVAAETLKKLYDKIASGEPAAFIDKTLYNEDGRLMLEMFNQNLQQNYIAGNILEDMAKIDSRFNTDIGIPNVNIAKESGVSSSEVNANNIDTRAKAELWLDTINKGLDMVNYMYGKNITCKLRFKEEMEGGAYNEEIDIVNPGVI